MGSPEYRPLATTEAGAAPLANKAGIWKRLHILKLILVIGFVLTIVNLFNFRFDMKFERLSFFHNNLSQQHHHQEQQQTQPPSAASPFSSNFGPKRLRPNVELTPHSHGSSGGDNSSSKTTAAAAGQQTTRTIHLGTNYTNYTNNSQTRSNYTQLDNPSLLSAGENNATTTRTSAAVASLNGPINIKDSNINSLDNSSNFRPSRVPHLQKQSVQDNNKDKSNDLSSTWNTSATVGVAANNSGAIFPVSLTESPPPGDNDEERLHFKTDAVPLLLLSNHSNRFLQLTTPIASRGVTFLSKLMTKLGLNACPESPPDLIGPLEVNLSRDTVDEVEKRFRPYLLPGGWYRPIECNAKDRVAIIIPFRDREEHLPVLLKNLHPMLMRQQVNYGIFVVEETKADPFNRASLMNVGFLEANKLDNWDCFIFHDVDLIPLDDRNLYRCPEQPRHMSVAIDVFDYKLPYFTIFGGVSALTKQQFHSVNGFSNMFWGWGGEDDDMSNRIRFLGYHISRYPMNIARYTMLSHTKAKPNPKRYEKLSNGLRRYENDGLNSVKYRVVDNKKFPLFTWFLVKLQPELLTGSPQEDATDYPLLKFSILAVLSLLLICIFKALLF